MYNNNNKDMSQRYFVYFGFFKNDSQNTKIGQTENIYSRICTYNTSHPMEDFEVYLLVEMMTKKDMGVMEALLLRIYDDKACRHSSQYNKRNHNDEWITYRPNSEEIKYMLDQYNLDFKYTILREEDINLSIQHEIDVYQKITEKRQSILENIHKIKTPLPYQHEIVSKIHDYFSVNNKGYIIEPCGLGKTFIAIYSMYKSGYNKFLIGVSSLQLQTQMHNEIIDVFPNATVKFIGGQNTSTYEQIKFELDQNSNKVLFVVTTYDSCNKLLDLHFDMKVGDECHHLVGAERGNKSFLKFHDIKSKKTLYMTATKKIRYVNEDTPLYSMDDENVFGQCIDEHSIKWAIEKKVITDYRAVVLRASGDLDINDIIGDLDITLDDKHIELFVSAYMTLTSILTYNLSHILCYTNTTKNADTLQQYINMLLNKGLFPSLNKDEFYNRALHSDCKCDLSKEVSIMENKKYGIISCVYIFGEGFNLPKLNGVCFVENMESTIRIIQCALRSARIYSEDPEKVSYILIPFVDHDDFNDENRSHKKIRTIISNLGNVDDNLSERMIVRTVNRIQLNETEQNVVSEHTHTFENDDLELKRLKLRLRRRGDLKSKISIEEEEYRYHKQLLNDDNIKSINEYNNFEYEDKLPDIETYFKDQGVWRDNGWYDLLSINTSIYPTTIEQWKQSVEANKIGSLDEYNNYTKQPESDLPEFPDLLYNKQDWSSFEKVMNIKRPRRR